MNDPVMRNGSSTDDRSSSSRTQGSGAGALFLYTLSAIALALFVRFFIAEPFIVQGSSMEPTFYNMHYLVIDRVVYRIGEPERGDVVVFKFPSETRRDLIKRIIGLPGETVRIEGSIVTIFNKTHPEGFSLEEPYVAAENRSLEDHLEVTLGADQFFVLGDNRHVSSDSRIWGVLPRKDIIGRVDVRLFPFDAFGILPGETRYTK